MTKSRGHLTPPAKVNKLLMRDNSPEPSAGRINSPPPPPSLLLLDEHNFQSLMTFDKLPVAGFLRSRPKATAPSSSIFLHYRHFFFHADFSDFCRTLVPAAHFHLDSRPGGPRPPAPGLGPRGSGLPDCKLKVFGFENLRNDAHEVPEEREHWTGQRAAAGPQDLKCCIVGADIGLTRHFNT